MSEPTPTQVALAIISDVLDAMSRGAEPPTWNELAPLQIWSQRASVDRQLPMPGMKPPSEPVIDAKALQRETEQRVVLSVFAFWTETTGHTKAKLTPERSRVVLARYRQGYDEARMKRAILGCAGSDFHSGRDPKSNGARYDDLGLILRDGATLERFESMVPDETPVMQVDTKREERIAELRQAMRDASERKDRAAYDAANAELKQLKKGSG